MNDIEVLIKRLGYIEESYLNNRYMSIGNFKDIDEAINLLKERQSDKERIKDLEEINEAHKKENGELREELESVKEIYYTQKEIETNYIPKSLIKEKIEEIKANIEESKDVLYGAENIVQVLEELLKGE